MDPHPECVSDPVTEENNFQLSPLPSEHRKDCQHRHFWTGIVKQLFAEQHLHVSYQAITEQLLDIPNSQWFI